MNIAEHDAAAPLQGLTILVSDDEVRLRQIIELMGAELGARVIAVSSSEEAVQRYLEADGAIDVVLLDVRMRGMSGVEAFRRIKDVDPGAKVVLASGVRPDDAFLAELEQAGGGFIEKPFDMEEFSHTLARIAGRFAPQ